MSKFELIEAIREINQTATIDFLSQFHESQLEEYLRHLRDVLQEQEELVESAPNYPFH